MGYSNTAPSLSDEVRYRLFIRLIESTLQHNPAMVNILQLFNWTRMATLSSSQDFVIDVSNDQLILNN